MKKPVVKDFICGKCLNDLRLIDKNKDKTDIELITEYYLHRANQYCKENNLEISEISVRKDELCDCESSVCDESAYYIEINFEEHGK